MEEQQAEIKFSKPTITFDDLEKIDVRICRIISVDDIYKNPKKEPSEENPVKAYHLQISTGDEIREVVTNVVDKFSKADLLDKEAAFILNLQPAMIRGVESRGMILLCGNNLITGKTGDKIL
jgi:tRNA-binding EMAP/Myf-like protein